MMLQQLVHYGLHFIFPGLLAWIFFRSNWKKAWLIMIATMIVDVDHLLASPVFSADRCSIGFHLFHSYIAIGMFVVLLLFKRTKIIATGLLFHMITDLIDCYWMT
ncbi:DUF6122 family protein [Ulvibacter antarcticus]|uniref:LexA-binding, inner membrane-associated hydrolase n=1 Tax=Ulvibacter antarcticus TaxID=442714 RepID=A0A3L9YVS9_9FLAO|nr:DUF6122 family protein [Ulvibacter antarcticus]RMA64613.1 hypothetical protein BXY75_1490 [Ulvibacter antarcticus]